MHAAEKEYTRHCLRKSTRETIQSVTQKWEGGGGTKSVISTAAEGRWAAQNIAAKVAMTKPRDPTKCIDHIRGRSASSASYASGNRPITSVVERRQHSARRRSHQCDDTAHWCAVRAVRRLPRRTIGVFFCALNGFLGSSTSIAWASVLVDDDPLRCRETALTYSIVRACACM